MLLVILPLPLLLLHPIFPQVIALKISVRCRRLSKTDETQNEHTQIIETKSYKNSHRSSKKVNFTNRVRLQLISKFIYIYTYAHNLRKNCENAPNACALLLKDVLAKFNFKISIWTEAVPEIQLCCTNAVLPVWVKSKNRLILKCTCTTKMLLSYLKLAYW